MAVPRLTFANLAVAAALFAVPAIVIALLALWLLAQPWEVVICMDEKFRVIDNQNLGDLISPPVA